MTKPPIISNEDALHRALNAAVTCRRTLEDLIEDSGHRPEEDSMEAVEAAKLDEEAAQAWLEANAPKCPGCKQAYAFQRQAKQPDRCSWCGYDHRTGEVPGLMPA